MYKKEGVNTFFGANSYIIPKIFWHNSSRRSSRLRLILFSVKKEENYQIATNCAKKRLKLPKTDSSFAECSTFAPSFEKRGGAFVATMAQPLCQIV